MSKKKRKANAKKAPGSGGAGGGRWSPGRVDERLAALARGNVRETAAGGMTPAKALEVAGAAHFLAGYLIGQVEAINPLPQAVACREGCDWCCYNQVEVTAPEALLLGHFVAANFSPEEKESLLERIMRHAGPHRGTGQSRPGEEAPASCPAPCWRRGAAPPTG